MQSRSLLSDEDNEHGKEAARARALSLSVARQRGGRGARANRASIKLQSAYRYMKEQQVIQENTGSVIQHVKDGKPLTSYGAKMLGVAWEGE